MGHFGVHRILDRLKRNYWWKGMDTTVACGGHIDDHQTQLLTQLLNTTQFLLKCAYTHSHTHCTHTHFAQHIDKASFIEEQVKTNSGEEVSLHFF